MNSFKKLLGIFGFLAISGICADTIYKSTDAAGKVTYSQNPANRSVISEKVDILPGPSAAATETAQREAQEAIHRADELVKHRMEYNQKMFEQMEKSRREAQKRAAQQYRQQYAPYIRSYSYPWGRPPYWGNRPPQRPVYPRPYPGPGAGISVPFGR